MFTLLKYVFSVVIWAVVAAAFLIAKSPELFLFWVLIGAVLILSWLVKFIWKWIVGIFFPTIMIRSFALFIMLAIILFALVYQAIIVPGLNHWGTTKNELEKQYPIDKFLPQSKTVAYRAVTIDAPVNRVYPLIEQLATEGLLNFNVNIFDLLKNEPAMFIFKKTESFNGLSNINVGDRFLVGEIVQAERNRSLTLKLDQRRFPWNKFNNIYAGYYLDKQGKNKTRVVMKIKADYEGYFAWFSAKYLIELGDYWVSRYQLNTVKMMAEAPVTEKG
ncbi:MAG: hypothetical protein B6D58_02980 [candidate division Zixibacteria bacterium 4484_95]|nr:MAG: hypothetical protein B6D58_02980 [candidate division Zixibacteria bacterium 4484_95]